MKNATHYRIEDVHTVTLNGRRVKTFKAYQFDENQRAYVFVGVYWAPARTALKNLWRVLGTEE